MLLDVGLLILRLVLGLLFVGHGAQKLFGWFGGGGLAKTEGWLGSMGMRPARFWAWMAALSEFGGGLMLALGLLSPLGSLGIIAAMVVAIAKAHLPKGLWNSNGGYEFPLLNLTAALALGLAEPGAYSLDGVLGISLPEPTVLVGGLGMVLLGVIASELTRNSKPAHAAKA